MGVLADPDAVVRKPGGELESATAREWFGPDPLIAEAFHRPPRHDGHDAHGTEVDEERGGVDQLDLHRQGVEGMDSEGREVGGRPIDQLLAALNVEEEPTVVGGGGGVDGVTPGPDEILGPDRFTGREGGVGP